MLSVIYKTFVVSVELFVKIYISVEESIQRPKEFKQIADLEMNGNKKLSNNITTQ